MGAGQWANITAVAFAAEPVFRPWQAELGRPLPWVNISDDLPKYPETVAKGVANRT